MTSFPESIKTFRVVENLPGVAFDETDHKTIYAEDMEDIHAEVVAIEQTLGVNVQGDAETLADRLESLGGGGGGSGLIGEAISDGYAEHLTITGLDLSTDKNYIFEFGVRCESTTTIIELAGTSLISPGIVGLRVSGGSIDPQTGIPFISHPSIGPAVGTGHLGRTENGSTGLNLEYAVGASRIYRLGGMDSGWYSGGQNLTSIKIKPNGSAVLAAGSYLRVYRRV